MTLSFSTSEDELSLLRVWPSYSAVGPDFPFEKKQEVVSVRREKSSSFSPWKKFLCLLLAFFFAACLVALLFRRGHEVPSQTVEVPEKMVSFLKA